MKLTNQLINAVKKSISYNDKSYSSASEIITGASGTIGIRIFAITSGIVTSLVLARVLGAAEYGIYAYAISWTALLIKPSEMGLPVLMTREVSRCATRREWGKARRLIKWSDRAGFITAAILISIAALLFKLNIQPELDKRIKAIWMALLTVPFLAVINIRRGGLRGLGYPVTAQFPRRLIFPGLYIALLALWIVAFSMSYEVAIILRLTSAAGAFLYSTFLLKKREELKKGNIEGKYKTREWLVSALPFLVIGAGGTLNQQISTAILGLISTSKAVGLFDIARKGSTFVIFALVAVNLPLGPVVSNLYDNGKLDELKQTVTYSARLMLIIALPMSAFLIIFGYWPLSLFGDEFVEAHAALGILVMGQLANVAMGPVGLVLNMIDEEKVTIVGVISGAILNVLLSITLIPLWGIEGAALATSLSIAFWNVLLSVLLYVKKGINPTPFRFTTR